MLLHACMPYAWKFPILSSRASCPRRPPPFPFPAALRHHRLSHSSCSPRGTSSPRASSVISLGISRARHSQYLWRGGGATRSSRVTCCAGAARRWRRIKRLHLAYGGRTLLARLASIFKRRGGKTMENNMGVINFVTMMDNNNEQKWAALCMLCWFNNNGVNIMFGRFSSSLNGDGVRVAWRDMYKAP